MSDRPNLFPKSSAGAPRASDMHDESFHLTALDVRRYDFGNALRGYDRGRVDQFRDQVAEEIERLTRVNQELDLKARNFHEQLKAFRDREKALNEALVSAQQLRGDIRQQAEREAQLIVREAGAEAERQLQFVQGEVRRGEEELQTLWRSRRAYLAQLRQHLERQLAELGAADAEPLPSLPSRDATRETGRDTGRDTGRGPTRDGHPTPRPSLARGAEPRDIASRDAVGVPELGELRELPPRASSPTPSWLDVVEDPEG